MSSVNEHRHLAENGGDSSTSRKRETDKNHDARHELTKGAAGWSTSLFFRFSILVKSPGCRTLLFLYCIAMLSLNKNNRLIPIQNKLLSD